MKLQKLHEKIWYYTEAISSPDVFIKLIEDTERDTDFELLTEWKEWLVQENSKTYHFGKQKTIKIEDALRQDTELAKWINNIKNQVVRLSTEYIDFYNITDAVQSSMAICKYNTGAQMGSHVDDNMDGNGIPLITGIIYLNDDYEGGELYFKNQNIKIKPASGSVILFPSTQPFFHESLLITSGNKYMIPFFWRKDE